MKLKIVGLALIGVLGLGGLVAYGADPVKVKSKVTISYAAATNTFNGKVKPKNATPSQKRKCRKGRTVIVKRVGVGTVGQDKTNRQGRYTVPGGAFVPDEYEEPGQFFAKAKKKRKGNVICKKARSRTITAP
jgi:hypothetical protein